MSNYILNNTIGASTHPWFEISLFLSVKESPSDWYVCSWQTVLIAPWTWLLLIIGNLWAIFGHDYGQQAKDGVWLIYQSHQLKHVEVMKCIASFHFFIDNRQDLRFIVEIDEKKCSTDKNNFYWKIYFVIVEICCKYGVDFSNRITI